jgi:hypothetical protein
MNWNADFVGLGLIGWRGSMIWRRLSRPFGWSGRGLGLFLLGTPERKSARTREGDYETQEYAAGHRGDLLNH